MVENKSNFSESVREGHFLARCCHPVRKHRKYPGERDSLRLMSFFLLCPREFHGCLYPGTPSMAKASGGEFLKLASPWCFQAWSAAELRKLASRVGWMCMCLCANTGVRRLMWETAYYIREGEKENMDIVVSSSQWNRKARLKHGHRQLLEAKMNNDGLNSKVTWAE